MSGAMRTADGSAPLEPENSNGMMEALAELTVPVIPAPGVRARNVTFAMLVDAVIEKPHSDEEALALIRWRFHELEAGMMNGGSRAPAELMMLANLVAVCERQAERVLVRILEMEPAGTTNGTNGTNEGGAL